MNCGPYGPIFQTFHLPLNSQLITAVDPSILKLTPMDDDIYKQFREDFKDLKVDILKEEELKNEENKQVTVTVH